MVGEIFSLRLVIVPVPSSGSENPSLSALSVSAENSSVAERVPECWDRVSRLVWVS